MDDGSRRWLHPAIGSAGPLRPCLLALREIVLALNADPAWHRWWLTSGVPTCELAIFADGYLDHLRPSADVHRTGTSVKVGFTCTLPMQDDRSPTDLLPAAADEITGIFEVVRQSVGMPPLPPVPAVTIGPHHGTVDSLPPISPELASLGDQQGYLTLAQIEEFYGRHRI